MNLDAVNGDIIMLDENGLSSPFPFLKKLSQEELHVFKGMEGDGLYDINAIIGLGYSRYKSRKIASSLVSKGVLNKGRGYRGVTTYSPQDSFPHDPRFLNAISDIYETKEVNTSDDQFIDPKIDSNDTMRRIELYWNVTPSQVDLIYYPYFICILVTEDGHKRIDIVDGKTGKIRAS